MKQEILIFFIDRGRRKDLFDRDEKLPMPLCY